MGRYKFVQLCRFFALAFPLYRLVSLRPLARVSLPAAIGRNRPATVGDSGSWANAEFPTAVAAAGAALRETTGVEAVMTSCGSHGVCLSLASARLPPQPCRDRWQKLGCWAPAVQASQPPGYWGRPSLEEVDGLARAKEEADWAHFSVTLFQLTCGESNDSSSSLRKPPNPRICLDGRPGLERGRDIGATSHLWYSSPPPSQVADVTGAGKPRIGECAEGGVQR
eukprot:GHVT01071676.1.p1 GENE.GHVT01071676.1~~GHVT01071676.1.p1  ORF type:complete len:224 (-),score=36.16 GHVT01071676.1:535-1206(-)